MKLKKIVLAISENDIMNFLQLQDKIDVNEIIITNDVKAVGILKFLNMKINFETSLSPLRVDSNNLIVQVDNFKILKMNILNTVSKKVFNYVISALTDFEGISFEEDNLKIEIPKLINRYFDGQSIIDLDKVIITGVDITSNEVEVTFGGVEINTESVTDDIPVVEAEIVGNIE